jgi:phage terminase large subunit-like protein
MARPAPAAVTIRAHRKQRRFLASTAPTVVFQGGARSGKTWAGVLRALLNVREYPGVAGMIVAPIAKTLNQGTLFHFASLSRDLGLSSVWAWNKSDAQVTFPNGSTIFLRTASDPDALNGATLGWAIGDEVALWPKLSYSNLQLRLSDPNGPRRLWCTFTPKGKNWAADGLLVPREGVEIIKATSRDNPTLTPDYFARQDRELGVGSLLWRQEVLGDVVAWEGLVYPQFSIDRHVADPPADTRFAATVYGVDWGWTNPGVILVGRMDTQGVLWLVDGEGKTERGIDEWAACGLRFVAKNGPGTFWCDPSEPANKTAFRRAGLRAEGADNAVLPGLMALGTRFHEDTIRVSPSLDGLISELLAYSYKSRADHTIRPDEPEKVNDHWADATRYLTMAVSRVRPALLKAA